MENSKFQNPITKQIPNLQMIQKFRFGTLTSESEDNICWNLVLGVWNFDERKRE